MNDCIDLLLNRKENFAGRNVCRRASFHGGNRVERGQVDALANAQRSLELRFSNVAQRQQRGERRDHAKAGGCHELAHGLARHGIDTVLDKNAARSSLGAHVEREVTLCVGGAGGVARLVNAAACGVVENSGALHIAVDGFGREGFGDAVDLHLEALGHHVGARLGAEIEDGLYVLTSFKEAEVFAVVCDVATWSCGEEATQTACHTGRCGHH